MPDQTTPRSAWHVLWTRSHCEELVHDQLQAQGFHVLLPRIRAWVRGRGGRKRAVIPMFPGYLFLCHAMDKPSYLAVRKARGLVDILGERWDALAVVPDHEVEAIERLDRSRMAARLYPYLRDGQRVRITGGPLVDVQGVLVRVNESKGMLVLSVDLVKRSIAVEVDCTQVVPV
ncbi:MAG TPA: transcription termination/antitermination NusG family protein [Candidatus Binatia bacterium]|nr:transcription termination/antitermination NusG family protein [Candidatus Binatia bacterium]